MKRKLMSILTILLFSLLIPIAAFAATTNRISNIVTSRPDTILNKDTAPILRIYEKDLENTTSPQAFELMLNNAEWADNFNGQGDFSALEKAIEESSSSVKTVKIIELSPRNIIVHIKEFNTENDRIVEDASTGKATINVPIWARLTEEGTASVTIDPMESIVSSGTYTFATVVSGSSTVSVEKKKDISENGDFLKSVVLKETISNSIEKGNLCFKLSDNWVFDYDKTKMAVYPFEYQYLFDKSNWDISNNNELIIKIPDSFTGSREAITCVLSAFVKWDNDKIGPGDICEMTVSGAGVDKTTLEVATAVKYGIIFGVEDKTLPEFYSGKADKNKETLQIQIDEFAPSSTIMDKKRTITLPEGVNILGYRIIRSYGFDKEIKGVIDKNKFTFDYNGSSIETGDTTIRIAFTLSISSNYKGKIAATLEGDGISSPKSAEIGIVIPPETSGGSSSGGGGDSSRKAQSIRKSNNIKNGDIDLSIDNAKKGDKVMFLVSPDEGYMINKVDVIDKNGDKITLTDKGNGVYTFIMPSTEVTINATFKEMSMTQTNTSPKKTGNSFNDVNSNDWYFNAVNYVSGNGIMYGIDENEFSPDDELTRAMLIQILYNINGNPDTIFKSNFKDVSNNMWYSDAVNWAAANGIISGYNDGNFRPDDKITRAETAVILMNMYENN